MEIRSSLIDQRDYTIRGDLALVFLIPAHPNVAIFTPVCASAVLDDPVVVSTVTAPANG
jgi:hypothetical protein